ncbi:hypothetical protein V8G54_018918 [Vigna mungo]|uniref:GRF-type domain-containing protein n=1 Tax=Vigna mungo TaxID=3915 RepID=A0AAQ3NAG8_VIGMU
MINLVPEFENLNQSRTFRYLPWTALNMDFAGNSSCHAADRWHIMVRGGRELGNSGERCCISEIRLTRVVVLLRRVLVLNILRDQGWDQGYCRCSSKRMSKEYSCCSSTCRRNETPICHCGQRFVMRTTNTTKNRGKHFWGCSKYKYGVQDAGCNFFKWCTDVGSEDNGLLKDLAQASQVSPKLKSFSGSFLFVVHLRLGEHALGFDFQFSPKRQIVSSSEMIPVSTLSLNLNLAQTKQVSLTRKSSSGST